MQFLQIIGPVLWIALALLVGKTGKKEGAVAYAMSGFFVFMAVWYALNNYFGFKMFEGVLGVVFKVLIGVFAVLVLAVWMYHRRGKK